MVDSHVANKFNGLIIAAATVKGLSQSRLNSDSFSKILKRLNDICFSRFNSADNFVSSKILTRYRAFFRDVLKLDLVNIKPKNEIFGTLMLSEEKINFENPMVGLFKYLSGATGYPVFGLDASVIKGDLNLRFAHEGESFKGVNKSELEELEDYKLVLTDSDKIILLYPYELADEVKITDNTRDILVLVCGVPGILGLNLLWALKLSVNVLTDVFNGVPEIILQENLKDEE
ncbi:MAG: phenylalanine--tRNA ligase beta subunit-related protein [Candidatus Odinarchaeia archaeon]